MLKFSIKSGLGFSATGWCALKVCLSGAGLSFLLLFGGCKSPMEHRELADDLAYDIISESQQKALGKTEDFKIIQPSYVFRRKLIEAQGLKYTDEASLGRDKLGLDKLWPDTEYVKGPDDLDDLLVSELEQTVTLSLIDALRVGAENNFDYQGQKESIFEEALDLDLERHEYRSILDQVIKSSITNDNTGDDRVEGATQSTEASVSRKFTNGTKISAGIAFDLANLLAQGGASAIGMKGDASISIPLLRGSGKHIVTENLTQAERNVIYAIYNFERYKREFAVNIANSYLGVLEKYDQIKNAEENYRGLVVSVRLSRRKADAGEMSEVEVDQAYQNQLSARNRWISAIQSYKQSLDEFKIYIGLPTDADIELNRDELTKLYSQAKEWMDENSGQQEDVMTDVAADAPIELPDFENSKGGPFEIDSELATQIAFDNRLDLRVTQGQVEDAERGVIVAADNLRAELTLLGTAETGGRRTGAGADTTDILIETDRAYITGLLTLDLPFERTQERNDYRKSLIDLEQSMRSLRSMEDEIKLEIRNRLRDLLSARESVRIQAKAVEVAQKRVDSTNEFLKKGRSEIRDVLEAQESLLSAQNSLTTAIKDYRMAELQLQRDMGVLQVNEKGLIKEIDPEVLQNAGK